ncbi:MAG TPA: helix-turn-helix domain-containing protein [Edaphobacter sp.]
MISAARHIFTRDGFEVARLQDIASAAGKTRGAFYAHFQDKEDVFFAIFEEDILADKQRYMSHLTQTSSHEDRVTMLIENMEAIINNRDRALLYIEFKMYAIHHPHKRKRLADLHQTMCTSGAGAAKLELLPELLSDDPDERRSLTAQIGSMLDGVILNRYFDPIGMNDAEVRRKVESCIRSVMSPENTWHRKA